MAQLADERIPTPGEGHLLAAYTDEAAPCITQYITAVTLAWPAAGPILLQGAASADATLALLTQRRISWGEGAQRLKQGNEEKNAKLHEIRD
jgi:hypothetical protein